MSQKRDYYEVLGVEKSADAATLKKAYRKKALEFHPDRNKSADAETKFKEVNEAYEVLSDSQKRATYDQFGHTAFDPNSGFGGGQAGRSGPFTYTYSNFGGAGSREYDFSDPFDIFESFFGGGSPFRQAPQKPRYSMTIEFMEAVKGARKTIVHQGKSHTINIPAGADDGTRMRFNDFDVTFDVKPHPEFKRDGDDIIYDLEVPFTMAALGGAVEVPTIDKKVKIKVRAGTQPGTIMRLGGQGVPHLRGSGRGDQYVRMIITIPKDLTREQKKLLTELDRTLR
jgi:DnaJ-class molecular chaperone